MWAADCGTWVDTLSLEGDFTRKKLSKFLCQELLYEFVTHNLQPTREKEVTDYLATCRDSQRELDNLNKGLRFTQAAAQLKISPKLYEALENFEPHWKKQLRAWTITYSQRGWKMLPYGLIVLAVILGIFITKPWVQKVQEDVMLAEQMRQEPDMFPQRPRPVAGPVATADSEQVTAPPAPPSHLPDLVESLVKDWLPMARTFKPSNFFVPIDTNATKLGRRKNRRVEFMIVKP